MTTEPSEGFAPLVYLAVIGRWKWLVIGVTLLAGIAGVAYLKTRTPVYQATAGLLYAQPVAIGNPFVNGGVPETPLEPDFDAVSALVASNQVSSAAAQLLKSKDTSAGYSVSVPVPTDRSGNSAGSAPANVVVVAAVSSDPQTAADAANAYAEAFVGFRRDVAKTQFSDELLAVQGALKSYATTTAKASADYLQLKQAQQALQLQLQSLTGDYSVTSPATPPSAPFSPRKKHMVALALILGLLLGTGLAFLLEQLDTRVRGARELTDLLDLPVLGHLPPLARSTGESGTVQMLVDPSGPMAEAIRVLRGNLGFTSVDGDLHSLLVSSSTRSEGKSVTACNLAVSMALAGQRVALVDADFRRPRIHTYMRVPNAVGLSSVLARRADLWDAVVSIRLEAGVGADADGTAAQKARPRDRVVRVSSSGGSGRLTEAVMRHTPLGRDLPSGPDADPILRVLPSGPLPPNPGEMAASQRFGEIIDMLADTVDLVIIDSPPLVEVGDTGAMAAKADGVLFVASMAKLKWRMLERAQAQLMKFPSRRLGLVIIAAKRERKPGHGYRYALPEPVRRSP